MSTKKRLGVRTLFDIALGSTLLAAGTSVADAQALNWTGFYIGVHAGHRNADLDALGGNFSARFNGITFNNLPGVTGNFDQNAFIGGPHVGFNWQTAPNFLVGWESDLDFGNSSKTLSTSLNGIASDGDGFTFNSSTTVKLGWQGTIRGRIGFIANNWMWYTTAGVAFAHVEWSNSFVLSQPINNINVAGTSTTSRTLTGWVVGTGFETMFTPNWIFRVEYLLEGFGDITVPYGISQVGTLDLDRIQKVRVGISVKM